MHRFSCNEPPNSPGIYIVCVRNKNELPDEMKQLTYTEYNNLPIIYVGISKRSLKKRDYRQHLSGNARGSTLRKSLGTLMGLERKYSKKEEGTSKYKFTPECEARLSDWMSINIVFYHLVVENPGPQEQELIECYNPPLNISGNKNTVNAKFRQELRKMRSAK